MSRIDDIRKGSPQDFMSKDSSFNDTSFSMEKSNSDDENRRNYIYDNESFKEMG
jgi:hypothetical protein